MKRIVDYHWEPLCCLGEGLALPELAKSGLKKATSRQEFTSTGLPVEARAGVRLILKPTLFSL